jgi:hypothetical protein
MMFAMLRGGSPGEGRRCGQKAAEKNNQANEALQNGAESPGTSCAQAELLWWRSSAIRFLPRLLCALIRIKDFGHAGAKVGTCAAGQTLLGQAQVLRLRFRMTTLKVRGGLSQ